MIAADHAVMGAVVMAGDEVDAVADFAALGLRHTDRHGCGSPMAAGFRS